MYYTLDNVPYMLNSWPIYLVCRQKMRETFTTLLYLTHTKNTNVYRLTLSEWVSKRERETASASVVITMHIMCFVGMFGRSGRFIHWAISSFHIFNVSVHTSAQAMVPCNECECDSIKDKIVWPYVLKSSNALFSFSKCCCCCCCRCLLLLRERSIAEESRCAIHYILKCWRHCISLWHIHFSRFNFRAAKLLNRF